MNMPQCGTVFKDSRPFENPMKSMESGSLAIHYANIRGEPRAVRGIVFPEPPDSRSSLALAPLSNYSVSSSRWIAKDLSLAGLTGLCSK